MRLRGLQIAGTYEFQDPQMQIREDGLHRVGLDISWIPWPLIEIQCVARTIFADSQNPRNRLMDMVLVLHAFL